MLDEMLINGEKLPLYEDDLRRDNNC